MLYREPKLLKRHRRDHLTDHVRVSVLYREPKLLKPDVVIGKSGKVYVSVLYREPKLLKLLQVEHNGEITTSFSALP